MERSEVVTELVTALNKFQSAMHSVPKTSANPFFHSKYADLDAVWEVARKPLTDNGLALVQTTVAIDGALHLETTLFHTTGQFITTRLPLNAKALDPQAVGSAITYARRYSMCAMLGISADEDDDGEKGMARGTEQKKKPDRGTVPEAQEKCPQDGIPWQTFTKGQRTWQSHKNPDGTFHNRGKIVAQPPVEAPSEAQEPFPDAEAPETSEGANAPATPTSAATGVVLSQAEFGKWVVATGHQYAEVTALLGLSPPGWLRENRDKAYSDIQTLCAEQGWKVQP